MLLSELLWVVIIYVICFYDHHHQSSSIIIISTTNHNHHHNDHLQITSMDQVDDLMRRGQKNRAVGSHDMNEHSSRSHSIITVQCRGRNKIDNGLSFGKLSSNC